MRIATLGDVMLDVIVRLEQPLARGDDVRAQTTAVAGGQAANVAAWAASLGANARCIAKRGDDAAGELVTRELTARGIRFCSLYLSRPLRGCGLLLRYIDFVCAGLEQDAVALSFALFHCIA